MPELHTPFHILQELTDCLQSINQDWQEARQPTRQKAQSSQSGFTVEVVAVCIAYKSTYIVPMKSEIESSG